MRKPNFTFVNFPAIDTALVTPSGARARPTRPRSVPPATRRALRRQPEAARHLAAHGDDHRLRPRDGRHPAAAEDLAGDAPHRQRHPALRLLDRRQREGRPHLPDRSRRRPTPRSCWRRCAPPCSPPPPSTRPATGPESARRRRGEHDRRREAALVPRRPQQRRHRHLDEAGSRRARGVGGRCPPPRSTRCRATTGAPSPGTTSGSSPAAGVGQGGRLVDRAVNNANAAPTALRLLAAKPPADAQENAANRQAFRAKYLRRRSVR